MNRLLAGCQYIPSIAYFAHWMHYGTLTMEACEHYQKRTWRNKTNIVGPDDPLTLTVPLQKGKHQQKLIQEVAIAYDEPWATKHLSSITTAYGKTAFGDEVISGLRPILLSHPKTLWELNLACLKEITSLMGGHWKIMMTDVYADALPFGDLDLRAGVPCGMDKSIPSMMPEYGQVQRIHKAHQPNLSILDAICHLGPDTSNYLARYAAKLYEPL